MNDTTRKFSRTLGEAFPPERDEGFERPPAKSDLGWWLCGVVLFAFFLYSCLKVPG